MNEYFSVKSFEINQFGNSDARMGKMKFGELINIVRFSNREENPHNPLTEKIECNKFSDKNFFQREPDSKRLLDISEFIRNELDKEDSKRIALFPTPIIISLDRDIEIEEQLAEKGMTSLDSIDLKWPQLDSCFIIKEDLIIPNNKNIALIVDGQHRLEGMKKYLEITKDQRINDLELPVLFLIGLDLYHLGEVFININFKQKSVNKSIYYDIFGSLPYSNTEEKLCHEIVLSLNNNPTSPLYNKIDLLGKGKGFVSQAQIVDLLIKYFKSELWAKYYRDFETNKDSYKQIVNFLEIYFSVIKESWNSCYPKEGDTRKTYGYILIKSTGMGALIRLISYIFPKVSINDPNKIKKEVSKIISTISDTTAKKLFDKKEGDFGKAGSYGLQTKLAKRLRKLMFDIDENKSW